MAITITHQPDMGLLARAGYYIGAGQDMKWQQEMAQRERMQERALQANFLSQQLANQNATARMEYGAALDAQRQAELQQQHQQGQQALIDLERQDRLERIKLQFGQQKEMERLKQDNKMTFDSNQFLFKLADRGLEFIRKLTADGYDFTPEERKRYETTLEEINKVMHDPTLLPTDRAQAVYQAVIDLPVPDVEVPDSKKVVEESLVERVVSIGSTTVKALLSTDRDNKTRLLGVVEQQDKSEPGKTGPIRQRVMQDPGTFRSFREQARKELTQKVGDVMKYPTNEEISKRMMEILDSVPGNTPVPQELMPHSPPSALPKRLAPAPPTPLAPAAPPEPPRKRYVYDPVTGRIVPK